jgi:hypothetical protein
MGHDRSRPGSSWRIDAMSRARNAAAMSHSQVGLPGSSPGPPPAGTEVGRPPEGLGFSVVTGAGGVGVPSTEGVVIGVGLGDDVGAGDVVIGAGDVVIGVGVGLTEVSVGVGVGVGSGENVGVGDVVIGAGDVVMGVGVGLTVVSVGVGVGLEVVSVGVGVGLEVVSVGVGVGEGVV